MQYQTCPHCGAHLDFGERCDCRDKKKPPPRRQSGKRQGNYTSSFYQSRGVLSSPMREEIKNEHT